MANFKERMARVLAGGVGSCAFVIIWSLWPPFDLDIFLDPTLHLDLSLYHEAWSNEILSVTSRTVISYASTVTIRSSVPSGSRSPITPRII